MDIINLASFLAGIQTTTRQHLVVWEDPSLSKHPCLCKTMVDVHSWLRMSR